MDRLSWNIFRLIHEYNAPAAHIRPTSAHYILIRTSRALDHKSPRPEGSPKTNKSG